MPNTVALVALLLTAVTNVQAGHHRGDIGQHRDQQQDLDALALARPVHAEAQPEQGTLDIAEAFFNLHALPVDSDQLVRQR